MIVWREKFVAFAIHFLVTLALAACAAALVFLVWFPDPFEEMIGGTELFQLVVGCDLALGPLLSLVIYNSRKTRRQLIVDYSLVGAVQVAALIYGLAILVGTRPVYVAFSLDRIEIVTARDITDKELTDARIEQYRTLPLTGPRFVAIEIPAAERPAASAEELNGNEVHMRPRFYVPYESHVVRILKRARTVASLEQKFPHLKSTLDAAVAELKLSPERARWLPVHHFKGFWTVLIDAETGRPLAYLPLDSFSGELN